MTEDIHDCELVANVHPSNWINPTAATRYHLVVIGGGPAGLVVAAGAAGLGAKVALIERDFMGGDCLNVGCVPSKALLRSARAWTAVRCAGEFGIAMPAGARVDFPAVMERMRRLRAGLSRNDSAERFRGLGVDVFFGQGRFAGPQAVEVGGQTLRFGKAVLATGARAARPAVPGLEEVGYFTNETIFNAAVLPARMAVVGAGPVGCELAQAFARFGAQVTLVANHNQILPQEDLDAVQFVESALKKDSVRIWTSGKLVRASLRGADKLLSIQRAGRVEELAVDGILLAVGREPNVQEMNLEAAGVAYSAEEGIQVDDLLRTTNKRIFAAGDCCSRFKFTHAADAMARLVIRNALFLGKAKVSNLTIPWCTYTDPEIGHIGFYEQEARERGFNVQTITQPLAQVDRSILDGDSEGFVRVHFEARNGRVLGATVVARHAGEMLGEIATAMAAKMTAGKLGDVIHPYPTQAEAIKKVGDAYNRTRLTPWVKWLLRKWLAWR